MESNKEANYYEVRDQPLQHPQQSTQPRLTMISLQQHAQQLTPPCFDDGENFNQ